MSDINEASNLQSPNNLENLPHTSVMSKNKNIDESEKEMSQAVNYYIFVIVYVIINLLSCLSKFSGLLLYQSCKCRKMSHFKL